MMSVNDANSAGVVVDPSPPSQWKWQLAFAVLVVVVAYLSVARWVPRRVQDVLFPVFIFLPIALNVAGWRLCKKTAHGNSLTDWRRVVVRVGLLANSLAIAVPWGVFLFDIYAFARHWQPSTYEIDWEIVVLGVSGLSILSLVAGVIATGWIRIVLVLNSLMISCFVLSIPMGIL